MIEVEGSLDVLLTHGGQDEWSDERQTDLAAVGVSGEHNVDEREARVLDDLIDVIGFVAHEKDGCSRVGGYGHGEVGGVGAGVIGATEPKEVAAAFEGVVAVDQDGCAVSFEGRDDVAGADDDVVVAEDAEALGFDGGEDLGADAGGFVGDGHLAGATADVVSGDEDEVGVEPVDLGDDALEEEGFGELFEVDIGDLDDAEVDEGVGEIADGEGEAGDLELVAGVGAGVGCQAEPSGRGSRQKSPASDGGL